MVRTAFWSSLSGAGKHLQTQKEEQHKGGTHHLGVVSQAIDPIVAHAVTELLLLAPEHLFWQVGVGRHVKGLPQDVLFHLFVLPVR